MKRLDVAHFLQGATQQPVLDVRTPAEFADGHIPGARNLALFSDEERAEVGTLYKQVGRREAVLKGLEFVGPKMRAMVEQVEAVRPPPGPVLVHCWRGGMRSSSVSWLLELYGYDIAVLDGGYKAYRRHVLDSFEVELPDLVVIGGLTGSGKTEVLDELAAQGEQVIDFEGLANHRGSVFGGLERARVTQQNFENALSEVIAGLDPEEPVWVEDESRMVGPCCMPETLWEQKLRAPLVCLEVGRGERLDRLVEEYGEHPIEELVDAFGYIENRLGGLRFERALEALEDGELRGAGDEALRYYDKAYRYGLEQRDGPIIARVGAVPRPSSAELARRCRSAVC